MVIAKNVYQGDYINQGSVLYIISNLSKLWAIFDAYETDLPFLKVGDQLEYTLQSIPGKVYKGRIAFINPMIDASSRTAKIRVEADNRDRNLKPEMYATAKITAPLKGYSKEMVIPKSANNIDGAYAFMSFMLRPENALRNAEYVGYSTPIPAAKEMLDEETQSDEAFYPSEETMKQMEVYDNLGKELLGTYNDLYLQFKMYRK